MFANEEKNDLHPQAFPGAPRAGARLAGLQPLAQQRSQPGLEGGGTPGLSSALRVCRGQEGPGAGRGQGVSELTGDLLTG